MSIVVRSECDNSLFGCCPDGVTTRKTFGDDSTCVGKKIAIILVECKMLVL